MWIFSRIMLGNGSVSKRRRRTLADLFILRRTFGFEMKGKSILSDSSGPDPPELTFSSHVI